MEQTKKLLAFVQENVAKAPISEHTLLFQDKILDSINVLDLIGYIELHLGRELTDNELHMENFKNVATIAKTFFRKP